MASPHTNRFLELKEWPEEGQKRGAQGCLGTLLVGVLVLLFAGLACWSVKLTASLERDRKMEVGFEDKEG